MTEEEIELFKALEENRSCTPYEVDCDNDASWLFVKVCCGVEIPLCESHKLKAVTEAVRVNASLPVVECYYCGYSGANITAQWRQL